MSDRIRAGSVWLLVALSTACVPAPAAVPGPVTEACVISSDSARPRITFATTEASLHIIGQAYETLLDLDCTGAVRPGLAHAWSTIDSITWRFSIASGSTFHDGTPVTARTIARGWSEHGVPFVAEVSALGDDRLDVTLDGAAAARMFAHLVTMAGGSREDSLPVGSGPYRIEARRPDRPMRLVRRSPVPGPDTIDIRYYAGDLRRALDDGADALVTSDPATLAYARARADYSEVPLPWSRTYLLLTPVRADLPPPPSDSLDALARDAVSADARAAALPAWWERCRDEVTREATTGRSDIVYPRDDDTARELAERIAALAWPRERAPAWLRTRLPADYPAPRAVPRAPGRELERAARTALAIIGSVAVPGAPACDAPRPDLPMHGIGWHWMVTPLIDTREHLIHRAGIGRVSVDGLGIIRFGR